MPTLRCPNAPAPARLFVQLSMRPQPLACGQPILDLLLPLPSRFTTSATFSRAHPQIASTARSASTISAPQPKSPWRAATVSTTSTTITTTGLSKLWHAPPANPAPRSRLFSSSCSRRATHTIFNPQVDDDGKEMKLEITPRAAKRLAEIMTKDSNPNLALRIQVESGGCHGFQYLMKLVTLPPSLPTKDSPAPAAEEDSSAPIHEDDTIFTYAPDGSPAPGDLAAPKIILDLPSLELLKGSKVDFTMELIGSQFKIVDNPLATSSCGCGTSFDIKI